MKDNQQEESDLTAPPTEGDAGERRADLTTGQHRDLGVQVRRDLSGQGRLARGAETRYSSLKFRSVGVAAPGISVPGDSPDATSVVADGQEIGNASASPENEESVENWVRKRLNGVLGSFLGKGRPEHPED